jgi:hypothetical protein
MGADRERVDRAARRSSAPGDREPLYTVIRRMQSLRVSPS